MQCGPDTTAELIGFKVKSMCVSTPAAAATPTGLRALLTLRQITCHFFFGRMSEHVTTIWHNTSHVEQEIGCKEKIKHSGKIKSPVFRVIGFNCAKGFPLNLTGPRSCDRHQPVYFGAGQRQSKSRSYTNAFSVFSGSIKKVWPLKQALKDTVD